MYLSDVKRFQNTLMFEIFLVLLAIAAINQAIDMNDEAKLEVALENPDARLKEVDETLTSRYLSHFVAVKNEKQEVNSLGSIVIRFLLKLKKF